MSSRLDTTPPTLASRSTALLVILPVITAIAFDQFFAEPAFWALGGAAGICVALPLAWLHRRRATPARRRTARRHDEQL